MAIAVQFLNGVLFGFVAIGVMLSPFRWSDGIVYDTRSVVLSIAGLFGGPVTALTAAFMAAAYRIYMGGMGATAGVLVIFGSIILGSAYHTYREYAENALSLWKLYIFGLIVSAYMLACQLTIPYPQSIQILKAMSLPVMLLYPVITSLVAGLMLDREQRARFNQSLRESEEKFRSFFEQAGDAMFILKKSDDSVFEVVDANEFACGLYNGSKKELIGKKSYDLCNNIDIGKCKENVEKILNGEQLAIELEHVTLDGRVFPVSIHASRVLRGNREPLCLWVVHDLSEIKRAQFELENRRKRLYSLLDLFPCSVYLQARDYSIKFANQKFIDKFGEPGDRPCYEVVHGINEPCKVCPTFKVFDTCKSETWETTLNGRNYKIYDEPFPGLLDEDMTVMEIAFDVTDMKKMEKDLKGALRAAESSNIAKTEFLSTMSHELRTPLNGILGFSEVLRGVIEESELGSKPEVEESLDIISSCGSSLLDLINDILELTTIESGQMTIENEEFVPDELIHRSMDIFAFKAEEKGLELKFTPGRLPASLIGAPRRLRQVLFNLIGNAVKFTSNGKVEVFAECPDGKSLKIEIKDTGIGIPEDQLSEILRPFYQVDQSTTRAYSGTGIGMSIVSRLLDKLGGRLDITSNVGQGTCVTFTIPVKVADGSNLDIPSIDTASMSRSVENLRLLLVEDDPVSVLYMKKILSETGSEYRIARSFAEMQEVCTRGFKPDITFLDISLPDADGIQCLNWLRNKFKTNHITNIAQTAHVFDEQIQDFKEAGFDDILKKPYTMYEFIEMICRHVSAK